MSFNSSIRLTTMAFLGATLLLVGCGKKVAEEKEATESVPLPISTITEFLSKQNISCEKGQVCPSYLAKLVVVQGNDYKFCTGFLVSPTVMATSSSCLPRILRKVGQDCARDIHFFFPKSGNTPALQASCMQVLQASDLDGVDPVLWRDDVAFLELGEPIFNRRKVSFSRQGPGTGKALATWVVDQQDQHSAIIKRHNCEPIYKSYVNPLASEETSPNLVFGDCALPKSSTGAPIVDGSGRVKSMASKEIDAKLVTYLNSTGLLVDGLKNMFHASNFACANILLDTDMADERECLKDLSYSKVDKLRSDMLATAPLFKDQKLKYENSLQLVSRHFNFGIKFVPNGDTQDTIVYPKCFKPLKDWLAKYGNKNTFVEELLVPNVSFRRIMDPSGKIQGVSIERAPQKIHFQFSLKNLRSLKKSSILVWSDTSELETFSNITECQ